MSSERLLEDYCRRSRGAPEEYQKNKRIWKKSRALEEY